jgi:hypothetical protein
MSLAITIERTKRRNWDSRDNRNVRLCIKKLEGEEERSFTLRFSAFFVDFLLNFVQRKQERKNDIIAIGARIYRV